MVCRAAVSPHGALSSRSRFDQHSSLSSASPNLQRPFQHRLFSSTASLFRLLDSNRSRILWGPAWICESRTVPCRRRGSHRLQSKDQFLFRDLQQTSARPAQGFQFRKFAKLWSPVPPPSGFLRPNKDHSNSQPDRRTIEPYPPRYFVAKICLNFLFRTKGRRSIGLNVRPNEN